MNQAATLDQAPSLFKGIPHPKRLGFLFACWVGVLAAPGGLSQAFMVATTVLGLWMAFWIEEEWLPVLIILFLALGSAYRWDIGQLGFIGRFALMGIVALRGIKPLFKAPDPHERVDIQRGAPAGLTYTHLFLILAGVTALYTGFQSVDVGISWKRAVSFVLLIYVVGVYFWRRLRTPEDIERATIAAVIALFLMLLTGVGMLMLGKGGMFKGGRLRLIVGNPNQLGHMCALFSPIAVWFLLEKRHWVSRGVAAVLSLTLLGCLLGSASRGGILIAMVGLLVLFVRAYPKLILQFIFVGVLVTTPAFLIKGQPAGPGEDSLELDEAYFRTSTIESGSGRVGVWKAAIRLIEQRPFWGYGFASTESLFQKGYFPHLPLEFQGGHLHNGYLEELLNQGWVGALPIFLAMASILMYGVGFHLGIRQKPMNPSMRHLGYALFSCALIGMLSSIFESWLTSVGSVFCFPFWFLSFLFLKMKLLGETPVSKVIRPVPRLQ